MGIFVDQDEIELFLMKKHQQNLKTQNQQVLRYSYMSNVKSAIPNLENVKESRGKGVSRGSNNDGFSSVEDALAALSNLSDGKIIRNNNNNANNNITTAGGRNSLQNSPIKRRDSDDMIDFGPGMFLDDGVD